MTRFHQVHSRFYARAPELRAVFDERFADPRSTRADRFVWDYWHVPDQYTSLRTPAWEYFPARLYRDFHESLVLWGRRHLGCWDISPPWLSCYVEGCQQHLHADVPHGPWAFVYSLTPDRPRFKGGETQIVRPEVLDYWPHFGASAGRERDSFVLRIPPRFNRLVLFDPRFPHGVTPVTGTHDPRHGRLVVHGWFTEPRPFATGALTSEELAATLDATLAEIVSALPEDVPLAGMLSVRIDVDRTGSVTRVRTLADTLVCLDAPGSVERAVTRQLLRGLRSVSFPRARGATEITLPLLFS